MDAYVIPSDGLLASAEFADVVVVVVVVVVEAEGVTMDWFCSDSKVVSESSESLWWGKGGDEVRLGEVVGLLDSGAAEDFFTGGWEVIIQEGRADPSAVTVVGGMATRGFSALPTALPFAMFGPEVVWSNILARNTFSSALRDSISSFLASGEDTGIDRVNPERDETVDVGDLFCNSTRVFIDDTASCISLLRASWFARREFSSRFISFALDLFFFFDFFLDLASCPSVFWPNNPPGENRYFYIREEVRI